MGVIIFSKELTSHSNTDDCDFYVPDVHNDWHDGKRLIGATCQAVAQFLGIVRAKPLDDNLSVPENL